MPKSILMRWQGEVGYLVVNEFENEAGQKGT
jgi:hypothetical protein